MKRLSRGTIKIMALCAMACNHAAYLFLMKGTPAYELLTAVGYFTAPCMCYFLAEGFDRTSSRKRYFLRLLFFACLSQPAYSLAVGEGLNMLFSLCMCFLVLEASVRVKNGMLKDLICLGLILLTSFMDWPVLAPVFTLFFYYGHGFLPFLFCYVFYACCSMILMGAGPVALLYGLPILAAGTIIILFYNGEKGRAPKWLFYLFYPAHLLVLWALSRF